MSDAFAQSRTLWPPPHLTMRPAGRLAILVAFILDVRRTCSQPDQHVVIDLRECAQIDPVACLLLQAEIDRARLLSGATITLRKPRRLQPRQALQAFGVEGLSGMISARDGEFLARHASHVASGGRGEPSPSERVFEVARLAEGLGDAVLADRVHAALNEAADNVISWAYDQTAASAAERWWVAGMMLPGGGSSLFMALDHGVGIPATAPRTLGPNFQAAFLALFREGKLQNIASPTDAETLLATIRYGRSSSRKDERGKGLSNIIGLIDRFSDGGVLIISGDASYTYSRELGTTVARETCQPLGFAFPGTMIVWSVKSVGNKGEGGATDA